jgi:hypothetical protein
MKAIMTKNLMQMIFTFFFMMKKKNRANFSKRSLKNWKLNECLGFGALMQGWDSKKYNF